MLDVTPSTLSKSKLKKLRRMGLIAEDTNSLNIIPLTNQGQIKKQQGPKLNLKEVKPKTINQSKIFKAFDAGQHIIAHGYPGTGKTFVLLYLALQAVSNRQFEKVVIVRSTVASRDMGFLPGTAEEKAAAYERPYHGLCSELYGFGAAYEQAKKHGLIEFEPTAFLRGTTFKNTIVVFDECQNATFQELDTVITRMGDNSRILFAGDFRQSDLRFKDEKQGLLDFMAILARMNEFASIEMSVDDILRSGMVRDYIITKVQEGRL